MSRHPGSFRHLARVPRLEKSQTAAPEASWQRSAHQVELRKQEDVLNDAMNEFPCRKFWLELILFVWASWSPCSYTGLGWLSFYIHIQSQIGKLKWSHKSLFCLFKACGKLIQLIFSFKYKCAISILITLFWLVFFPFFLLKTCRKHQYHS